MKVAVMKGKGNIVFEDWTVPAPGPDELLIHIDYVGICGSDIHLYQTGTCGGKEVKDPCVLGHEAAGTVAAKGDRVTQFEIGDRVAIEPQVPCMQCNFCKTGHYNLCPDVKFYASPPTMSGCFAEYVAHPAGFCYRLPDGISTLEGALIEPLSVGLHAVKRSGIQAGNSAAVIGAGCIGLMTMLSLLESGVKKVFVIDVMENRLNMAKDMGCYDTVNSSEVDKAEYIKQACGGVDVVFETAGRPQTIQEACLMAKRGGTIMLVGYPPERKATLYVNHLINQEITIRTSFRYCNTYPLAMELLKNGLPVKKTVTDFFEFEQAEQGLVHAADHKDQVVKCVVRVNPEAERC